MYNKQRRAGETTKAQSNKKQQDNKTTLTRRVPVQSPIGISKTRVQSPMQSGFLLPASHSLPPTKSPPPARLQWLSVPKKRESPSLFRLSIWTFPRGSTLFTFAESSPLSALLRLLSRGVMYKKTGVDSFYTC